MNQNVAPAPSSSPQTLVVVLGMHRSGTSAITRSLQTVGVSLGDRLMPPAADNDKGFYEDMEFVTLNDEMLKEVGRNWDSLEPIQELDVDLLCKKGYLLRAVRLLRSKLDGNPIFGIKDPRTAKLLLFWQRVFTAGNFDVRYVLAYRNPLSVVHSLQHRDGFEPEKSFILMADHLLTCLLLLDKSQALLIDYDQLMSHPEEQLLRLSEYLQLPLDEREASLFCNEFLEGGMRHFKFSPDDLQLDVTAVSVLKDVHEFIHALKDRKADPDSFEADKLICGWRNEMLRWTPALKLHDVLEARLRQSAHEMARLHTEISERSFRIKELDRCVHERDEQLRTSSQELAVLEEKHAHLLQLLMAKEQDLERLGRELRSSQHTVNELLSSTSWMISRPVRMAGRIARKLKKLLKTLCSYSRQYSLVLIVKKVWRILTREGIAGLKFRLMSRHALLEQDSAAVQEARLMRSGQKLERIASPSYAALLDIDLASIDVLSLDVFDTAIIRLCDKPEGIFNYVGDALGKQDMLSVRIEAEKKARSLLPDRRDISLAAIYEQLDVASDTEVAAELAFCVANPEIFELYRRALSLGKKVYFVSDMYLPKSVIESILKNAGYITYEETFASSEDDLIKGDGSRYTAMKPAWDGLSVLHIGDNYLADVQWPRNMGYAAHHYAPATEFYEKDHLLGSQYKSICKDASIGISFLLGSYRYWKNGFKTTVTSFWRDVGFFYGGPLIHGFAQYLKDQLDSIPNRGGVYFLARDGRIVQKVYETLYGRGADNSAYLFASRRCMTFPLLALNDRKQDDIFMRMYSICESETTAQTIFEAVGHPDLERFRQDLLDIERDSGGVLYDLDVMGAIKSNLEAIREKSHQETNALISYLRYMGVLEKNPVLVDVGWSGTIQDALSAVIKPHVQKNTDVFGIYLGTWPWAKDTEKKKGFMFDSGKPAHADVVFRNYVDFIELLTSSDEDGIVRIEDRDGTLQPSYHSSTPEEQARKHVSREIQRGIHEYARLMKTWGDKKVPELAPADFVRLFEALTKHASDPVVAEFEALKHSRTLGGPHLHDIIKFDREV